MEKQTKALQALHAIHDAELKEFKDASGEETEENPEDEKVVFEDHNLEDETEDETTEEKPKDETEDETKDETEDETKDETEDETTEEKPKDETEDETKDETEDETTEEKPKDETEDETKDETEDETKDETTEESDITIIRKVVAEVDETEEEIPDVKSENETTDDVELFITKDLSDNTVEVSDVQKKVVRKGKVVKLTAEQMRKKKKPKGGLSPAQYKARIKNLKKGRIKSHSASANRKRSKSNVVRKKKGIGDAEVLDTLSITLQEKIKTAVKDQFELGDSEKIFDEIAESAIVVALDTTENRITAKIPVWSVVDDQFIVEEHKKAQFDLMLDQAGEEGYEDSLDEVDVEDVVLQEG